MVETYDMLVSGGGPAGASAAWRAATAGAKVLVCDRAAFPRDKPCGDGLTPRAVRLLTGMGLGAELERFHRVNRVKVVADTGTLERQWPQRPGLPSYGYVVPRTELDTLLIEAAARAGAEVRQEAEVLAPLVHDGKVGGLRIRTRGGAQEEVHAPITIAADGTTSRTAKALGMGPRKNDTFAVAVRAQVDSLRPDDPTLECFANLHHEGDLLPGYGWVFPMGNGRLNIGLGYMSSYPRWKEINVNALMAEFVRRLPAGWQVPTLHEMQEQGVLNGWRLPLGLPVWPPWRPGLMAAGDAVGAAKPFTGVGISKAIQSGMMAAEVGVNALAWGDPSDLSGYEAALSAQWGSQYRLGRYFVRLLGDPRVNRAIVTSGVRAGLLSDFLVSLFMGGGDTQRERAAVTDRLAAGATRLAALGGRRNVDATDRIAVPRPPNIRSSA